MASTMNEAALPKDIPHYLESKKYQFVADGTMPVLDFDIKSGKIGSTNVDNHRLTIEIYHPMSGEVFEAKYDKVRIEVDKDGSVTYFTTSLDHASFSMFLKRNVTVSLDSSGRVVIRSPSRILSVEKNLQPRRKTAVVVESDSVTLQLE
jgi:hypothetical protein